MKKTFLSVLLCLLALGTNATTVTYQTDSETIFPNPERGFLKQLDFVLNKDTASCVSWRQKYITRHASEDNGTLILVLYYLDNYRNVEKLPQYILDGFDADMKALRANGAKCILRFAYAKESFGKDKTSTPKSAHDAPLSIIEKHINQYKSYWEKNKDVIFVVQAGFAGQYGEWYYTENFGNHIPYVNSDCKKLLDTVLNAMPKDRCLLLRRPILKQQYLDSIEGSHSALDSSHAYKNTAKARLGHFNDAFLYNEDNMGTYSTNESTRKAQKKYVADETLYVPLGGETDITDTAQAIAQATRERTISEMSTLHWTFIKAGFSKVVTDMWRRNGTFDELNRKLGYRYQLEKGTYGSSVAQGGKLSVNMSLKNVGFAPLYNKRHAYIVLKNGSKTYKLQLASDPRTWKPNGATTTINEQLAVPANAQTGTYQLYLYLPDYSDSLKNKSAYAIRFANKNMWDEATGMNNLNAQVTVTASGNTGNYVSISGTLNKSNVASVSNDMTYYNTDYFDFGPTDAQNTGRWAEWNINVSKSGEYTITTTGSYTNGHQWNLILDGDEDHPYSMPSSHKKGEVVTETGTTTWYLSKGTHTICVRNVKPWGQPKLLSVNLTKAASPAIVLPATLNMANVSEVSDNMAYYESDYFDFGPVGVKEQTSYAKWDIQIPSAGNYSVTIEGYYPNGHRWEMELEKTEIAYTLPATWDKGIETVTWNLPAGTYTLVIHNIMEWGRPKLKSITLTGAANHKPQAIDEVQDTLDQNAPMYDIMGRRVDASYKGIVIQNNKKYLLW